METIVSLLSPAAWKLVKQGSIRKGLGSPQASSSPRLTSEHQESNSQNVWGRCGGKHTKSDETLTSWGSPTPPVDLPIHGVLHKVWPHEIENSTTTGVLWNLHSKFSNESTVITGFDTRVWVFCYCAKPKLCLLLFQCCADSMSFPIKNIYNFNYYSSILLI